MSHSSPKIPFLVSVKSSAALPISGTVFAQSTATLPSSANSLSIGPGQPISDAFASVPSGFDPLTASDPQLEAYGFPWPPPSSQPQALADWRQAMLAARVEVSSGSDSSVGSDNSVTTATSNASAVSSNNWGGYAAIGSNNGDVLYTEISANWIVPSVPANSNYPNGDYPTAPAIALWTGMGGVPGSSSLDQAGFASISTATPQYRFWYEDVPAFSPQ